MRKTPVISFLVAALAAVAALNEGNLNHWGTTLVLALVAVGAVGLGVWAIRE